jgi:8-oxo-dGTP pyrophosphatase MutT (NUDIX family)
MSLIDHIHRCQNADMAKFLPWYINDGRIGDVQAGWVRRDIAARLAGYPTVFSVDANQVQLKPHLANFGHRSAAVGDVARDLYEAGAFTGWRGEWFPVLPRFGETPLMRLERSAVPMFGVHGYGVHMNGYVRDGDRIKLWVGKRAADRPIEPGKLDHLVAGGIPLGMSPQECLRKECEEEADISASLAAQARPVGAIRYRMEHDGWLRNDTMFVYDLELPADFRPRNNDGEIESFRLMELDEARAILAAGEDFKFNVALVVIDFLIRHGYVTPDDADYSELALGMWQHEME